MRIEHSAFLVSDPVAIAHWYQQNLEMKVVRSSDGPSFTRFLADSSGSGLVEIYRNDNLPVPDYRSMDPLVIHLAFASEDVAGLRARLLGAGATAEGDVTVSAGGDELAMVRDPWGFPVQIVRRKARMI